MDKLKCSPGIPFPLGVSHKGKGYNFALFSTKDEVSLALFSDSSELIQEIQLALSGNVWHAYVENLPHNFFYCYKIKGKYVVDPYAKKLNTGHEWGKKESLILGEVEPSFPFHWEGDRPPMIPLDKLIIYEMHVRGFTKDPSAKVSSPGTFLGMIEKIPYLKELGITAVELLPLFEFDETVHPVEHLYNYWGIQLTISSPP